MNGLQFADGVLAQIRKAGGGYDERAYLFLLAAVEYLQSGLETRRHVTGAELAWACQRLAVAQYGLMAATVLEHWGVRRTEDFGRMVYILVDVGLLVTQPGDHEADFAAVYDFADVFGGSYDWQGIPGTAPG